jgi:low affinity Fe/Cu permease
MANNKTKEKNQFHNKFEKISSKITKATGSPSAVLIVCMVIIVWALTGPFFHYSDTWQLLINTSTTIVTFIMVFIIQHSQNKDTVAIQLKLNELIATNNKASNRLVNIEELTEEELTTLKEFYVTLAKLSAKEKDIFKSHSIDEAKANNQGKQGTVKKEPK